MTTSRLKLESAKRLLDEISLDIAEQEIVDALRTKAATRTEQILGGPCDAGRRIHDLDVLVRGGEKFGTIYADPPWPYENTASRGAAENHYRTMPLDAIAALPVASLTANDAHLHLWTTNAFLFDAQRIIDAWGFTYKSCLVWIKPQLGAGNYWRVSHEFLLLGTRGQAAFQAKNQRSWHFADRTRHSSKPSIFRKLIEQISPAPRLELFARNQFEGWTTWGNQIERDLFSSDEDHRSAGSE